MVGIAYAEAAAPAAGGGAGFASFIPLILIFAIFYFLLIRPQQKKAKEHHYYLSNLKKGERVVTGGGLHGRITGLTDTIVTLEIASDVRVKISRGSIMGSAEGATDNQAPVAAKGGG